MPNAVNPQPSAEDEAPRPEGPAISDPPAGYTRPVSPRKWICRASNGTGLQRRAMQAFPSATRSGMTDVRPRLESRGFDAAS